MMRDDTALDCHWMLLRLAGTAPDDLLTQSRRWLAEDRGTELARAIGHTALAQTLALRPEDPALLGQIVAENGGDAGAFAMLETSEFEPALMHAFAPTRDVTDAALAGTEQLAARVGTAQPADPEDRVDQAAIESVAAEPGGVALWRSWRFPVDRSPWPAPRRVYVLETTDAADVVALTGSFQDALVAAGERDPQVEVYPIGADLPNYQRMARAYGAIVWTRTPTPDVRLAAVFDWGRRGDRPDDARRSPNRRAG